MALDATFIRTSFLRGLTLEDADGRPMDDAFIEARIKAVKAKFERKYGVRLQPTAIKLGSLDLPGEIQAGEELWPESAPGAGDAVLATPERHGGIDYHQDQSKDNQHFSMELPVAPIREVRAFGLWLPGMQRPSPLPSDWCHWQPRSNRIRFYPGRTLSFPILMQNGVFANLVSGERPVPHAWHVSYIAGYTPDDLAGPDADVMEAVGKMVALDVLVPGSVDRNLAAGITGKSVSVDGLSQNLSLIQNAQALKYQPYIAALEQDLKDWENTYWARRTGVRFGRL